MEFYISIHIIIYRLTHSSYCYEIFYVNLDHPSGYGVSCWQHQFSSITEVKQHVPALVIGWVTVSVKPFELRPLVL